MEYGTCHICGRVCRTERHHIFSGARRPISEKYDLTVELCPDCHQQSRASAHRNAATAEQLHKDGQRMAMLRFGWTAEEFRLRLGKNYLDAGELEEVYTSSALRAPSPQGEGNKERAAEQAGSFRLLESLPLMF